MPPGWSLTTASAILSEVRTFTHYIQLHTGDPGSAGTASALTDEGRVLCTFAVPAGDLMVSNVALDFTDWTSGSTVPTHFTSWSASSAGTFQGSGVLNVSTAPSPGATLTIASGGIVFRQTVAS